MSGERFRGVGRVGVALALVVSLVVAVPARSEAAVATEPGLRFVAVEPCAVFDTRHASGGLAGRNDGGDVLTFVVVSDGVLPAGQGGEDCVAPPSEAVAVELNLVAVLPAAPGNLKVAAAGMVAEGGVVNFEPGGNNSSSVPVGVDGSGRVDVEVNSLSPDATFVRGVAMGYYVPADAAVESLLMVPVTPCAVFDTRATAAGRLVAGESRTFQMAGSFDQSGQGGEGCGAPPAGAAGVVVNLVAVNPTSNGNLKIVADGGVADGGVVNFRVGANNSNAVPVGLSGDGKVTVTVNANDAGQGTDVRGVVLGYYIPPDHPNADLGLDLVVTTACAVFDTRAASGGLAGRTDHLESRTFTVASDVGLPAGQGAGGCVPPPAAAAAVVVNLVAIGPTAPGNLQVAPAGTVPDGGVVNFDPATGTNSNAVITGLAGGQIDVVTKAAADNAVHLREVTLGWYQPADPATLYPKLIKVSPDNTGIGSAQISGDGQWIYYVNYVQFDFEVWRVNTETLERTQVPIDESVDLFALAHLEDVNEDGRWLVLTGLNINSQAVLDTSDGSVHPIPANNDITPLRAQISADGRYVMTTDSYDGDLVLWDRELEESTTLLNADATSPGTNHMSAQAPRVAYQAFLPGDVRETYVYDHSTGEHHRVSAVDNCFIEDLSADGSTLSCDGYLIDVATGDKREVADTAGIQEFEPFYSRSQLNMDGSIGIWWTQATRRGWWHVDTEALTSTFMEETLDGSLPSNGPSDADLSYSGRRAAILSTRPNMVPGDPDFWTDDVFLWDMGPTVVD